ncbi:MAG: response regulator [Snowella sp.]|nr:response regulator [Snowella sp.]
MKILLVEDDEATARLLADTLTADSYIVDVATDGQMGWELVERWEYDLLVLDIGLPRLDGLNLCRQIRAKNYRMPILLLTARDSNEEMILGLDSGADDYLTKPFDLSLLLARIRVQVRRGYSKPVSALLTRSLACGTLSLNGDSQQVIYNDREIELRRKEYQLLELLLRYPGRVFSRDGILDRLWTSEDSPTEGAVTNLIKDLRQRLKGVGIDPEIIETVYGSGYRLKKELPQPLADQTASEKPKEKTVEAIAQASEWFRRSLPKRIEQLAEIEREAREGTLTAVGQKVGKEEAHKLVGGLGTFGFVADAIAARQIETLLNEKFPLSSVQIEALSQHLSLLKESIQDLLAVPTNQLVTSDCKWQSDEVKITLLVLGSSVSEVADYQGFLQPWGIHVIHWDEPKQFQALIATITPDILLLDANSSAIDPFSFCRSLRQDLQWGDLPILVLSDRCDPPYLQQIFAAGADDFIMKPVIGPELVSRTISQVERSRSRSKVVQACSEIDPLTQLASRPSFDRQLSLLWSRLESLELPLVLMLVEIDGLSVGNREAKDRGLPQVARELGRHVDPRKDLLARYGEATFVLLFPETALDQAIKIADGIEQALARLALSTETGDRQSINIGITGTIPVPEKSVNALLTIAEQALQAARWRGGNTYCLYPF